MSNVTVLIAALGHYLSYYGALGLFAISFLDSSFLAFPVINDLLVIRLSSTHPHRAVAYAAASTAGSLLGAWMLYVISRSGRKLFSRKGSQPEKTRVKHWIERNDFVSILVASLLPPPTPFKLFPLMAGGLRMNLVRFLGALLLGRGARFAAESWVGARFGSGSAEYLKHNIIPLSLLAVGLVILWTVIYRKMDHPPGSTPRERVNRVGAADSRGSKQDNYLS